MSNVTRGVISVRSLSKRYGGVQALNNLDLDLERNIVHAIVGENGAGKSTFMKILSGGVTPDLSSGSPRSNCRFCYTRSWGVHSSSQLQNLSRALGTRSRARDPNSMEFQIRFRAGRQQRTCFPSRSINHCTRSP